METKQVNLLGTVRPDGTLELDGKVGLPAGRVRITIEPIKATTSGEGGSLWETMEKIWAAQKARGHVPRSKEAIDAELQTLRDEAEEEFREVEAIHEECERERQAKGLDRRGG
jgi:hypothetical protein